MADASSASLFAARPSLDWTLHKLTGEWPKSGEMISCPLTGHDDSTPSFNIWDEDADGLPLQYGCFGCGRKGDVMSLISEIESLQGTELGRRADELAAEEAASPAAQRKTPKGKTRKVVDLDETLRSLESGLSGPRLEGFQQYMASKGLGGEAVEVYAMDIWGWVPAERGSVAVPHRGPAGELTGIKYRARTRKWSAEGSRWPHLYGTWLDKGRSSVVLCEGESDALWAAWSMRNEPVDVLALPSGASQSIADEWLAALKGRKVFLVLDSDNAGMTAAKSWVNLRPDSLLARLPEGEDLLSCGIPVNEVLARAAVPQRSSGIIDLQGGVLVRAGGNGNNVPVADFGLNPVRELITDDGPAWEVSVIGKPGTIMIRPRDLGASSKMRAWSNLNHGAWLAGDKECQGLFSWLAAESSYLPLEETVSKAGRIGRSFVGPGFCIGSDKVRYVPPVTGNAKLADKIHITEGNVDMRALAALEQLNTPAMMSVILGWLCATLMRGKQAPAPPLFVSGESGSGKTSMISTVLGSFGFKTEMALTTTTPYGVDCMVNSCVGFPVWFDEFRGGAREDSLTRLRQLLRDAYFGQPSIKGGMTANVSELTEISTWAGIVVSGEMGTHETSHRDRMIMIDLTREGKNANALAFLKSRDVVEGLGHSLLTFLARREDVLFQVKPAGPSHAPDRLRAAMGFVEAGWDAWKQFRWEHGLHDKPVEPDFKSLAAVRALSEDPYLEAIKACEGMVTKDGHMVVQREENGDITLIPGEVVVEAKRLGIELPARAHELKAWLASRWEIEEVSGIGRRRAVRVRGMDT
jgi:hypothetical protein